MNFLLLSTILSGTNTTGDLRNTLNYSNIQDLHRDLFRLKMNDYIETTDGITWTLSEQVTFTFTVSTKTDTKEFIFNTEQATTQLAKMLAKGFTACGVDCYTREDGAVITIEVIED